MKEYGSLTINCQLCAIGCCHLSRLYLTNVVPAVTEKPSESVNEFSCATYASHSGVNFLDSNSTSASVGPAKFKT